MFRSKEIQLLKDMLARERAERLDLLGLMQTEREAHRKELAHLQDKLTELIESLIKPRGPTVVAASSVKQYPMTPTWPGYRPGTEPDRADVNKLHLPKPESKS